MNKSLYITALLALAGTTGVFAQNTTAHSKLNAHSLMMYYNINEEQNVHNAKAKGLTTDDETHAVKGVVQAFIEVKDVTVYSDLEAMGVIFGYGSGTITTAELPVERLDEILAMDGVLQVEFDEEAMTTNDKARVVSHVDEVHQGVGLDRPYTGKGVIIGALDTGIDFNHTLFNDKDGNTRLLSAYMISHTQSTALPGGVKYKGAGFSATGTPVTSMTFPGYVYEPQYIKTITTDKTAESHGTHTFGIAAGGTYGHQTYYGMAPEASIIATGGVLGSYNMLNAAAYTFSEAERLNMPAVMYFSIGDYRGCRSGDDLFPRLARTLVGPGRIICVATGNEAGYGRHLEKPEGTSYVKTAIRAYSSKTILGSDYIDLASNGKKDFMMTLSVVNTTDGSQTILYQAYASQLVTQRSITNTAFAGSISVYSEPYKPSQEYGITINLSGVTMSSSNYLLTMELSGMGEVDAWCAGKGLIFTDGSTAGYTAGDSNETENTLCIFPGCISVGNYNSRNTYTWFGDGKGKTVANTPIGQINKYSGYGIDRTGVAHPTIAAPGAIVCSGASLYDDKYKLTTSFSNMLVDIVNKDGRDNRYAMMQGTSMATPHVAGIIALWLEANPSLTPDDIKNIFAMTATQDQYTAASPLQFGYGKINAYDGIKKCIGEATSIARIMGDGDSKEPVITMGYRSVRILVPHTDAPSTVDIFRTDGTLISHDTINGNTATTFPLPANRGLYIIKVKGNGCERTVKVIRL